MYFCKIIFDVTQKQKHNKSTQSKSRIIGKKRITSHLDTGSRKHNIWTAVLTILGLIIVHVVMIFHTNEASPLKAYLSSQASVGCFYVNMIALLSTAYGKATYNFHVNGRTFLLSMLGYVFVAHIFAQAVFMVYPEIKLYAEFMRSEWFAIIGHVAFFAIIFILACSKGVAEYTKELITN